MLFHSKHSGQRSYKMCTILAVDDLSHEIRFVKQVVANVTAKMVVCSCMWRCGTHFAFHFASVNLGVCHFRGYAVYARLEVLLVTPFGACCYHFIHCGAVSHSPMFYEVHAEFLYWFSAYYGAQFIVSVQVRVEIFIIEHACYVFVVHITPNVSFACCIWKRD